MPDEPTSHQVIWQPAATRQLIELPRVVQPRLVRAAQQLAFNPRTSGVTKLTEVFFENLPLYRVRVGDYRSLYSVRDEQLLVLIVSVADRKEVYR